MVRPLIPRNLTRSLSPAKLLLAFFIFVLYIYFPFHNAQPPSVLDNPESRERLGKASLAELVDIYEQVRTGILDHQHYNSSDVAQKLRAPPTLPNGSPNFDPRLANYVDRLRRFADEYLRNTPNHITEGARGSLKDVIRRAPPQSRPDIFPSKVWSTHPAGSNGVEAGFELWRTLLPLPLSPKLAKELSPRQDLDWLKPARAGQPWEVIVTDDDGLDKWMSEWTSERISRGIQGDGKWSKLWGGLDRGVLRADLFRYVSMFVAGGIYSDSDTMNLLVSKPFHPIMLDTLATISELVDSGVAKQLSPLDLTGPGPFSDAVFRYLLVQYGVTPDDLRSLRGPVRVGDVLILQEEAWHAPEKAITRFLSHVHSIGSNMLGGVSDRDPWLFGQGWDNWQSGGKKVAYHGLTGIWKGKSQ
ncbi:hypothetical protein IAT40_007705 [Kwoniella sp. CBS 6097]